MRRELVPGIELENMEDKFAWGGGAEMMGYLNQYIEGLE